MRVIKSILCVIVVLMLALPAFACYTGMNVIPTVDMVGQGALRLDLLIEGDVKGIKSDTWILNSQYGLSENFEFGIDHDFSDGASPRNLLNAKYLIPASAALKLPIALGVCSVADHSKADLYAVTAYQSRIARLHFGVGRLSSKDEWFVGADKEVGTQTLMLEYVHGRDNSLSLGTAFDLTKNLALSTSFVHPNDGSADRFVMYLGYSLLIGGKSK